MGPGEAIRHGFAHYADVDGRASRREFWWFCLFVALVNVILSLPLALLLVVWIDAVESDARSVGVGALLGLWMLVTMLVSIGLLIPSVSVGARRLHDCGQPAWWLLLCLVPFGWVVLLVFWIMDGSPGVNAYGPRPT